MTYPWYTLAKVRLYQRVDGALAVETKGDLEASEGVQGETSKVVLITCHCTRAFIR